jgi:polyhydroxyalkanoate synthesis regulator phasin
MKQTHKQWAALAGVLAAVAGGTTAHAQSADALLDKLVDKGILTPTEAKELREEADKDFTRAFQAKMGMPDWVTSLKLNGDVRGRIENFNSDNEVFKDRTRFRYRLRLGVVATVFDNFEAGLRLSSSDPAAGGPAGGDPISGNTTFQDNGSRKFIYVDLAYGKWTMLNNSSVFSALSLGKIANPFVFST